jgi:regulator of sirC expression with transglutaminase-like and TPR domain
VLRKGLDPSSSTLHLTFDELARASDDAIDVALGAALIAQDVYEALDVGALVRRVDDLAGPLGGGAIAGVPLLQQAEAVSERFRELGFRGNVEDYYDARNSLLPDVLDRRIGIPITLTVVWCAIAHRAGVLARGVGFPGHFLARVDALTALGGRSEEEPVIVDPFSGGRLVSDDDARALLERSLGKGTELHPTLFEPATSRATLVRMLTNLKTVWARKGEHTRAFVAIDRIVTLVPDSARSLRERAGIALRLGIHELARADLARVLELEPRAPDAPQIQKRLAELRPPTEPTLLN